MFVSTRAATSAAECSRATPGVPAVVLQAAERLVLGKALLCLAWILGGILLAQGLLLEAVARRGPIRVYVAEASVLATGSADRRADHE